MVDKNYETWVHRAVNRWMWLMTWSMERGLPVPMSRRPAGWLAEKLMLGEVRCRRRFDAIKRGLGQRPR